MFSPMAGLVDQSLITEFVRVTAFTLGDYVVYHYFFPVVQFALAILTLTLLPLPQSGLYPQCCRWY